MLGCAVIHILVIWEQGFTQELIIYNAHNRKSRGQFVHSFANAIQQKLTYRKVNNIESTWIISQAALNYRTTRYRQNKHYWYSVFFCWGGGGTIPAHFSPLGIRLAFSLRPKLFKVAVPIILEVASYFSIYIKVKIKKKLDLLEAF